MLGTDKSFTTYQFTTATAVTVATLGTKVQTGVMSLTFAAASPLSVFKQQRLIGFYRDATWTTCLGVPIYDYGTAQRVSRRQARRSSHPRSSMIPDIRS